MVPLTVVILILLQRVSAQLDGLFGGLSGLPQLPGLPQLVPLTLPQLPSLPSLIPTGGGGDPLSQMLGNLGVLFQGIPQPPVAPSATLPPLPPPASPPPLPSPPLILPLSSTEITTIATVTPAPETSIFITFPTLVSETDVLNAENIDNGQTSFLGVIPDEDYATEEDIDGAPDFTGFLSHGDHWTTEGKRNDKNSQPDGRGKSHVNDGDTENGDHSVIGRPPPLPGLVGINERDEEQPLRFRRDDLGWKTRFSNRH